MAPSILVIGLLQLMKSTDITMEFRSGAMEPNTKAIGNTVKQMVKAHSTIRTATATKATGSTTKPTAKAPISTQTAPSTKANGKTIYKTATE